MAKTEITKILFRRGEEKHRRSLYPYGGLDNGEPGWTSVSEKESGHLENMGLNPSFPDLSVDTYSDGDGLPVERSALSITKVGIGGGAAQGMCDLWIGGGKSEEDDIYIGGQSAEYYNQMRFISLSGTDLNHPYPWVQGNLTVGTSGVPYKFHQYGETEVGVDAEGYDVTFQSNTTLKKLKWDATAVSLDVGTANQGADVKFHSDLAVPATHSKPGTSQYLLWDQTNGVLDIHTSTALWLPVGNKDERPGDANGVNAGAPVEIGMIRYNSELLSFEGFQGTDPAAPVDPTTGVWSSLGGVMSKDRCTYITPELPTAPDGDANGPASGLNGTDDPNTPNGNLFGEPDRLYSITRCVTGSILTEDGHLYVRGNVYSSGRRVDVRAGAVKAGVKIVNNAATTKPFIAENTDFGVETITRSATHGGSPTAGMYTIRTKDHLFTKEPIVNVSGPGIAGFTLGNQQPAVTNVNIVANDGSAFNEADGANVDITVVQPYVYHRGSAKDGDDFWANGYTDSASTGGGLEMPTDAADQLPNTGAIPLGKLPGSYLGMGEEDLLEGEPVYRRSPNAEWYIFVKDVGGTKSWYLSTQLDSLTDDNSNGWYKMGAYVQGNDFPGNAFSSILEASSKLCEAGSTNVPAAQQANFDGLAIAGSSGSAWCMYVTAV